MRGVSITGRLVFEGDAASGPHKATPERFAVAFAPKVGETGPFPERVRYALTKHVKVAADGGFVIEGVPPGAGVLSLRYADTSQFVGDYALRFERGGTDVSRELEVKGNVTDVILTVRGGHGVIRGHVRPLNGPLPVSRLKVLVRLNNPASALGKWATLNPDGGFEADGLPAGDYDVVVVMRFPNNTERGVSDVRHVRLGGDDALTVDFPVTIPEK
jgi:hypothetical protein